MRICLKLPKTFSQYGNSCSKFRIQSFARREQRNSLAVLHIFLKRAKSTTFKSSSFRPSIAAAGLFQEQEFRRADVHSRLQPAKVDSASQVVRIESDRMNSRVLNHIHQRLNFPSEKIVYFQRCNSLCWQLVRYDR